MVTIKEKFAHSSNYGAKRQTSAIKYIVIHYTANDGDTDEANANYFSSANRNASAHYFVDDDSISRSVKDDYVAWSVGGSKYSDCSKTGGGKFYGKCTNNNSISIEMCDTKKDGKIMVSDKTRKNTIDLTVSLMKKYNIDIDHVIRHFDVTGKNCPAYYVSDTKAWDKFKSDIKTALNPPKTTTTTTKKKTTTTTTKKTTTKEYKIKVLVPGLNVRKGAGMNYAAVAVIKKNEVYTIVEEKNGWGKLKSGAGWINLSKDYVKKC